MNEILKEQRRKAVSDLIREGRKIKSMTQADLASAVGLSKSTITRVENNSFSPNSDQLYLILDVLDMTLKINNIKII